MTEHFASIYKTGSCAQSYHVLSEHRTAVCLSGQLRTAIEVAPAIINFFRFSLPSIDFYIHTWTTESLSPWDLNGRPKSIANILKPVSDEKIQKVLDIYKPILYRVDDLDLYQVEYKKYIEEKYGTCWASIAMFQSLWECNNLKKKTEEKFNRKYWRVIKIRFDQVFRKEHSWEYEQMFVAHKDNALYVCDHYNRLPEGVEDIAWYGTSKVMDVACDFAEVRASTDGNGYDWQTHMMDYMTKQKIPVKSWKDNTMMIYRDHHYETLNVSPFDIDNVLRLP